VSYTDGWEIRKWGNERIRKWGNW